jgi:PAS domain S-box-containing protein
MIGMPEKDKEKRDAGQVPESLSAEIAALKERCARLEETVASQKQTIEAFRTLIEATTEAAFLMDERGTIIIANMSAAALYESTPARFIGSTIYRFLPRDLLRSSRQKMHLVFANGIPAHFEIRLKGSFYENSVYPVTAPDGTVYRLAVFIRDITEKKRVEAALEKTRITYRNIYENATEGIFQTSPDGRFISANPSLARIHGYGSPQELIDTIKDMTRQLYVNAADRDRLVTTLHNQGHIQNFEVEMHRKDGSLHWISINARAVRDDRGKIVYYEGTMQDISERKAAEGALVESEERYRTAIEHSNDGVAIILEDRNVYVNRQFLAMFGFERTNEIVGKSTTAVVHPDDLERVRSINLMRQQGQPVPSRYEFKGLRKDGTILYVEVSATEITYRGMSLYLVYLRDVTERKEAEEALLRERNRFQSLSEHAPFGIAMVAGDGAFTYTNPKFTDLFGYDRNDVPSGADWFRRAFPDPAQRSKAMLLWIEDVRNTRPGERMPRTFVVTCKDGSEKTINFIPVRLASGEHIITFEDISERIRAQESLMRSHQELERLSMAKTKAVNHISHELKTPLAVILGNLRLLKNKLGKIEGESSLPGIVAVLERNIKRLFAISRETDEIFRVSQQLEAGMLVDELDRLWQRFEDLPQMPAEVRLHWQALKDWFAQYLAGATRNFQPIDLYPFALQLVEKIKKTAGHRPVRIDVDGVNDLFIFMDPSVLSSVVTTLLKNALENTPDGGLIRLSIEMQADRVLLRVIDFGVGITEENQQYIFDGLFHTRETELYTSRKPYDFGAGGKGLELLLLKAYAQHMGFEVSMSSRRCRYIPTDHDLCPGDIGQCTHVRGPEGCEASGGTTFTLAFPAGKRPVSA